MRAEARWLVEGRGSGSQSLNLKGRTVWSLVCWIWHPLSHSDMCSVRSWWRLMFEGVEACHKPGAIGARRCWSNIGAGARAVVG